jgi:hypothetical protein
MEVFANTKKLLGDLFKVKETKLDKLRQNTTILAFISE